MPGFLCKAAERGAGSMFASCVGEGHINEDDEAFARRLQEEADREHYARLIELTGGGGSLEAAFREGR